jgi:hypothetical protein
VVLYLNELFPSRGDIDKLRREIADGTADLAPKPGSEADVMLRGRTNCTGDRLPLDFRLARAVRVYAISEDTIDEALTSFDGVVARIEACRALERASGLILSAWEKNPADEGTCAACDARTFCPSYRRETAPALPGLVT